MSIGEQFEHYRPSLFAFAYRMVGSASEAEDILQDAYIRYATESVDQVPSPRVYLGTIVTQLCLDHLKSAQAERAAYLGSWLPEPVLTGDAAADHRDSLSMAFLGLLDGLTPPERAVLLLHDVLGYTDGEVAQVLGQEPKECQQLCQQARQRVAGRPSPIMPAPELGRALAERFLAACRGGDQRALADLLARDVTVWSDGGSKAVAARRPVQGQEPAIRFLVGLMRKASPTMTATYEEVNAGPALLVWDGGELVQVITFDLAGGKIGAVRLILNTDKFAYLRHQLRLR